MDFLLDILWVATRNLIDFLSEISGVFHERPGPCGLSIRNLGNREFSVRRLSDSLQAISWIFDKKSHGLSTGNLRDFPSEIL
jgi:hypothetical protein